MSDLTCPVCLPERGRAGPYRNADQGRHVRVPLASVEYEPGIHVLGCTQCDGLWLEEGQLLVIQQNRTNDYRHVTAMDVVMRHRQDEPAPEPPCPRCSETLIATTYKTTGVPYATCVACGGTWLTRGALQDIEAFWETTMPR